MLYVGVELSRYFKEKLLAIYINASFMMTTYKHHMQATLLLSQMPSDLVGEKLETERFYDAVNVILYLQVCIYDFPFLFKYKN
jgi:hypothetical protein